VPFLAELLSEIDVRYPALEPARRIHELVRRVITRFVEDVIRESERRLGALAPCSADAIRAAGEPVVAFSDGMAAADAAIKAFLHPHMYRHPRVAAVRTQAEGVIRDLFRRFTSEPADMPEEWRAGPYGSDDGRLARRVADYIAGMTDNYALQEHRRLFAVTPELR